MEGSTKDELIERAEEAGVDTSGTKADIEERLEAAVPPELGPTDDEREHGFEVTGSPITGVQPASVEEIPEAGR